MLNAFRANGQSPFCATAFSHRFPETFPSRKIPFLPKLPTRSKEKMRQRPESPSIEVFGTVAQKCGFMEKSNAKPDTDFFPQSHILRQQQRQQRFLESFFCLNRITCNNNQNC